MCIYRRYKDKGHCDAASVKTFLRESSKSKDISLRQKTKTKTDKAKWNGCDWSFEN